MLAIVCAIVLLVAVATFQFGVSHGRRRGYERGLMDGHREGQRTWIRAMEARRGPDGHDALLNVRHG